MKCPKCGGELLSGTCPTCGFCASNDSDDIFAQYTGYASDNTSAPSETSQTDSWDSLFQQYSSDVLETPPVPETQDIPQNNSWEDLARRHNPIPAPPPVPETQDIPQNNSWEDLARQHNPTPAPPPVPETQDLPENNSWEDLARQHNPTPAPPPVPETQDIPKNDNQEKPAPFVRLCPVCGRPMPKRFCGNCGYDSGPSDQSSNGNRICPVCGHHSKGRYCGNCGRDLLNAKISQPGGRSFKKQAPAPGQISPKKKSVAAVLCLLLGFLGIHRMYVGKWGTGILCMLLCGLYGIWPLIDLILILTNHFFDKEGRLLK